MLSRSRLYRCENKKIVFATHSVGFLLIRLVSEIPLSCSKTGAVDVSAPVSQLIAYIRVGIISSPASFPCSRIETKLSGPPFYEFGLAGFRARFLLFWRRRLKREREATSGIG